MITDDGLAADVVIVDGGIDVASLRVPEGALPGLVLADLLARLQLVARRQGWTLRFRQVSEPSSQLLALIGLDQVLGVVAAGGRTGCGSVLEHGGKAERREEDRIEEVVEPGDAPS